VIVFGPAKEAERPGEGDVVRVTILENPSLTETVIVEVPETPTPMGPTFPPLMTKSATVMVNVVLLLVAPAVPFIPIRVIA
jgi:hypothetical protein